MTQLIFEPSHTTHWKNLFPNKMLLLGSQNLNPNEELIAKIDCVRLQEIKNSNGKNEEVGVIQFENAPPMVLNITNARTIASLYGERYDQWKGKSVQIYATRVKAFGQDQMALRIRAAIPATGEDVEIHRSALENCKSVEELKSVFMSIPKHLKPNLAATKDAMKETLNEKG